MYNDTTTIEDIYRFILPKGTQLLAGEEYLARAVSWACSLRPSPPAFPKLEGNELALIDMEDIQRLDPKMRLERVVNTLESARVSAIAVRGLVEQAAIQTAQASRITLIQLPDTLSLIQIERRIIRFIVDRDGYITQSSAQLQRELNQIALDGGSLEEIACHIHQFVQLPTLLLRDNGQIITWAGLEGIGGRKRQAIFKSLPNITLLRSWAASRIQSIPENSVDVMALEHLASSEMGEDSIAPYSQIVLAPVIANEGLRGYCILLRPAKHHSNEATAVERIAAAQGASAAALEWAKQNAVDVAEEQMRATFLDELLAVDIADEQAWVQRGKSLGYDLLQPHAGIRVTVEDMPTWAKNLLTFISEQDTHVPYSRRGKGMLLFWPIENASSGRELKSVMYRFVTRLQNKMPNANISIGIGRPAAKPVEWLQSQQQAYDSWRLGQKWNSTSITYFGDLGLYQLLTSISDSHEANRFFYGTLGQLIEHDRAHNGELVQTLEGFFTCHNNLSQTAKHLHIHRNTLTYRMERIRSITRLDLDDPDARFSLNLALKLRPVIRAER